ncbi:energy-coupling factor transporter transmembrane protein EcfT [Schaalia sp. ZJ405]|uniref:energy-coupling factor transporter transmembrane component T n=1 Tax=Schaalia sp. ZJ405 TaxID=2709403 RepID=UPI0013EBFF8A|nr:energy-coupling factor transporter transmembrane component T [Schaalia sp. ZJ405]QPK80904.1 energy-coupling factor transporter transmembrane protein EcfT [Schaalia sp. ZJ405]
MSSLGVTLGASPAAEGHSQRPRNTRQADPRTKLAFLLTMNVVALGRGPFICALACAGVVMILLATNRFWRSLGVISTFLLVGSALYLGLPRLAPGPVSALIAGLGFWATRFAVAGGAAFWFLMTTSTGELSAALDRLRVPRVIVIPLTVMLRFIPLVVAELRAIVDAMRVRGVIPSGGSLMRHPVKAAEYAVMPLIAAMMRMTDDLSASALLRGLGRPVNRRRPRTSVIRLGFSRVDAVILVVIVGLCALRVSGWEWPR